MQPFDALTIRAVLQEAKPILLNRRVDKVLQLGRDEIVLTLRSKAGMINLLMSAQTAYGRLCLVKPPQSQPVHDKGGRTAGGLQTNFCLLLRKHLTGATLVGVEQPQGERMVDFIFSCVDEVGTSSFKVLTAEIMGRHSNLIFWDKTSSTIVCASHIVTKEMSRQREVAPGLRFERPPGQDKSNIFAVSEQDFAAKLEALHQAIASGEIMDPPAAPTLEQWLINCFTGLGKHLSAEIIAASGVDSVTANAVIDEGLREKLWEKILKLQNVQQYKPAMKNDLSTYTVLSWWPELAGETTDWKGFPAVNDLIEEYYRMVEAREQFNQLRERLRAELKGEGDKLEARINAASQHLGNGGSLEQLKRWGDLVLANINDIGPGQEQFVCQDLFEPDGTPVTIKLNPNISPAQNAQSFYRQFAKSRARQGAATVACREAQQRLDVIKNQLAIVDSASSQEQLRQLKDSLVGRKPQEAMKAQLPQSKKKNKARLMSVTSSDGWTIYVGRNRQENDYLLGKLALPYDFWLHIQGQGGAHVLIRVPSSKQDPPMTTLKEAAQVAARMSKAAVGSKVRVVYTQCRYVNKIANEKPGVVNYENERTLEVDTAGPMPQCMKQLFQQPEREHERGRGYDRNRDRDPNRDRSRESQNRDPGREGFRDPNRDRSRENQNRDPGREGFRDPNRDRSRESQNRDPGREGFRDPNRDRNRDNQNRDPAREGNRDPNRDRNRDNQSRDPAREGNRDPGREGIRDPNRDLSRENQSPDPVREGSRDPNRDRNRENQTRDPSREGSRDQNRDKTTESQTTESQTKDPGQDRDRDPSSI